jgi:hypothetical protein
MASGYAGTADLIAIMDDQPTLLDWKTSDRIKKRQWIDEALYKPQRMPRLGIFQD